MEQRKQQRHNSNATSYLAACQKEHRMMILKKLINHLPSTSDFGAIDLPPNAYVG